MRHRRWLLALLLIVGCGGSGGGGGVSTPGGGEGGGGTPTDRPQMVAALTNYLVPQEQKQVYFGEYAEEVMAATNKTALKALEVADATFKQHIPTATSRHSDNAPTGPEPAQGLVIPPIDVPSTDAGPFKVSGAVKFAITHEDNRVGYTAKLQISITGELLTIPVSATLRIEGLGDSEYCPNMSGKIAGVEMMSMGFDITAQILGHQSFSSKLTVDRSIIGTVDNSAELAGLDKKTHFTNVFTINGNSEQSGWDATTSGALPPIGSSKGQPGSTTTTPPTGTTDPAGKVKMGDALAGMLAWPEETIYKHVRDVWQGGHCVVVEHINEEHEEALRPGDTFEVDLRVMHRHDQSTVTPVQYKPSLDAKYVQQVGPGHFKITVPETEEKARQMMSTVTFVASTNRGRGQIRHHYSINSLRLDSVTIDESTGILTLTGNFGSAGDGTVTVGGVKAQIVSWSETQIKCKIPVTGSGSSGSVVVKTGDPTKGTERVSNSLPLTSWRGQVTYTFHAAGTLKQEVTLDLHLRAGLKGATMQRLDPASDSTASYQANGKYEATSEDTKHTFTWSGSGNLIVTQTPQGPNFATFMGVLDPGRKVLSFTMGASVPTGLTIVHTWETPPDPPQTLTHPSQLLDTGYLSELQNQIGAIEVPLSGYDIVGGTKSANIAYPIVLGNESGTVTVTVSPMSAEFAP